MLIMMKFSTYAVPMIMGKLNALCDDGMIKVAVIKEKLQAELAKERLTKILERELLSKS